MAANGAGPSRGAAIVEAALRETGRRADALDARRADNFVPPAIPGPPDAYSTAPEVLFDAVVSVGFCGALDPSLRVGDIVVASAIHGPSGEFDAAQPVSSRPSTSGPVASIDHVAQTASEKARLRATGAVAVEMEAAGIAPIVRECKIRLFCIKSVSDLAGEGFSADLNRALRPDGRFDLVRILLGTAARPLTRAPELLRLRSRCRKASESLGDFIASCRF